jgi:5-oxopent-3-ene-1,2,5-tricarboxylate decarboxylase/2-hydroxyhepta-2,4-diene-1,7-dioate isomerase
MLVNLHSAPGIHDALACPAGRAVAEDRPLARWQAEAAFAPPLIATAYGTLLNHRGALAALGDAVHAAPYKAPPKAPVLYIKPRSCLAGHGGAVEVPADAEALEVGAQLGIVIGREACRVAEAEALNHVAGYTICSDLSVPHPSYYRPSLRYKARDGFLPLGPWILAARHVPDPDALEVVVQIDGREAQRYSTAGMQRSVARLIADVTDFMTLSPGDLLMLGAGPAAPWARAGQTVQIHIAPIGTLQHRLVAEGTA